MKILYSAMTAMVLLLAAGAAADPPQEYPRRIAVTGEGRVDIPPDMAIVTMTVNREAPTAREAVSANSAAMEKVMSALQELGIEARDLQTAGFSIQPQYTRLPRQPSEPGEATRKLTGYVVRNSLTVRVRAIDTVGEVLDKSVAVGINEGGSISFTNEDPSAALEKARIRAVEDAIKKARTLAGAAGVRLGDVLEIGEHSAGSPRPMQLAARSMEAGSAVPVAQGENTYRVTVNVSYAIAD
ncbi:MAG: SIMPL domain-containing protein [Halioglobus sp.]|nr:SIMPL domain-containing protein [Halioglobus sp.]